MSLYLGISSLKPHYYVTSDGGMLLFLSERTGKAGACGLEGGKVRCFEQDWSAGR